jgi:biopolymer transport protein ExbD
MRLRDFRTFLSLFTTLCFVVYFTLWNYSEQKPPAFSFTVKIPKAFNANFTDEALWQYVESGNDLPIFEFQKRGMSVPHHHAFLFVSLEKDKKLKINSQDFSDLQNPNLLTEALRKVFLEREQLGVFEENGDKIVKSVIIKAPRSAKYGEVVKLIDAVKVSGAEPVILQIDDLPE